METQSKLIGQIEEARSFVNGTTVRKNRAEKGQFFTPAPIACYMASLFENTTGSVRILDAGAGVGSLFSALIDRLISKNEKPNTIELVVFESDISLLTLLEKTILLCKNKCLENNIAFSATVRREDFIKSVIEHFNNNLFDQNEEYFSHIILNPPYRKINGQSQTRALLNTLGFETSNLYAAFVWLAIQVLKDNGELVAITPRSFCNGPYFRKFRKSLIKNMTFKHIHLFESRKEAFSDDSVLQESIIFHCVKESNRNGIITISTSKGTKLDRLETISVPYKHVINPEDKDAFIHILEVEEDKKILELFSRFYTGLHELELDVSTGRVVDFRAKEFLCKEPQNDTVPLIYSCHFNNGCVQWPIDNSKKPNAIKKFDDTFSLLVPSGYYVLTKRFSAKEERRRVVSALFDPTTIITDFIGFENHLNYFHSNGHGISPLLARGLTAFLNSSLVDRFFRLFSGHTQVNATDLRKMRYPSKEQLVGIGQKMSNLPPNQNTIDLLLHQECFDHD